ncbi:hypothetical protein [Bauldia sp.]|uniref:hypothetical protein n=1 Tax=Bauldia sp. TaxID=2575872 RepID=UPI003BACB587
MNRFSQTVLSLRWLSLLQIFLGCLMVNQFFSQWGLGHFGAEGFAGYARLLANTGNISDLARAMLNAMADNAAFFGFASAVFLAVTGVALMLLVLRSIMSILVSLFFFVIWYVTSNTSGIWTFEYLFPALFALIVGLATLPQFIGSSGRDKWLGARVRGSISIAAWSVLSVIIAGVLTWFFIMSRGGGQTDYLPVALASGAVILALLIATGLTDEDRQARPPKPEGPMVRIAAFPWVDLMIIIVGAMVCIQIFADIQVNWFTIEGYQGLIRGYADTTGAPTWWAAFLYFAADNAAIIMPLQMVLEFSCAFFLVTLLLRPLALLATTVFFGTLMMSEFGTPVGHIANQRDWEWELLFVTGTIFALGVMTLAEAMRQSSWRALLLGDRFYTIAMPWRLVWAAIGAGLLWLVGIQTKMFGSGYETISLRGSLFFFAALVVMAIIDQWRRPVSTEARLDRTWVT